MAEPIPFPPVSEHKHPAESMEIRWTRARREYRRLMSQGRMREARSIRRLLALSGQGIGRPRPGSSPGNH